MQQVDIGPERRLVVLHREEVVGFLLLDDEAGGFRLGVQRVERDYRAFDVEILEQRRYAWYLVGLVGHPLLGDQGSLLMGKRAEKVRCGRFAVSASTNHLAVHRYPLTLR